MLRRAVVIGALARRCTLALGLGTSREAAATLALSALAQDFDALMADQTDAWRDWHRTREAYKPPPDLPPPLLDQLRHSAQVLKSHQDKTYAGAMVASLSFDASVAELIEERDAVAGLGLI